MVGSDVVTSSEPTGGSSWDELLFPSTSHRERRTASLHQCSPSFAARARSPCPFSPCASMLGKTAVRRFSKPCQWKDQNRPGHKEIRARCVPNISDSKTSVPAKSCKPLRRDCFSGFSFVEISCSSWHKNLCRRQMQTQVVNIEAISTTIFTVLGTSAPNNPMRNKPAALT